MIPLDKGDNRGTTHEQLEWVVPQILLMGAGETNGKAINNAERSFTPAHTMFGQTGPS